MRILVTGGAGFIGSNLSLKLLKEDWPEERLGEAFQRLKLSPRIRAEEVSLEQFTQMAQALFRNPQ